MLAIQLVVLLDARLAVLSGQKLGQCLVERSVLL
jgi:hypothetical protein